MAPTRYVLVFLFLSLAVAPPVQAARAAIEEINADPYVSALVLNGDTGEVLIEENADLQVYPASVLKLMVLLVVLDRIEQGTLRFEDMVQVTDEAYKTGGSQVYLDPREQFSVDDLLYALIVQSANDAAVALAMHVAGTREGFVEMMNRKAEELGMDNTRFHSVHGLPPSEGQGVDVTTARDLALLCRELVERPRALVYTSTRVRDFRNGEMVMRTHNHLLQQVDGCDGLKTGYFKAAGFSIAATARRGDVRIIALVMGSRDRKVRDAKAAALLSQGFTMAPGTVPAPTVSSGPVAQPAGAVERPVEMVPPQQAAVAEEESVPGDQGGGWGRFFSGLAAGVVLTLAVQFALGRKSRRANRRYIRR